tara:strand:+ start:4593 stop:4877 length:285 start_codon:yes stop_codon:yes gene_type:complete
MKLKIDDKEILVKNISYKDKLGLQGEFADVYKNGTQNVKQKEFNILLGNVAEIAFNNPEEDLKKYDYDFQLKILSQCLMDYLGLSNTSKKGNGD